MLHTRLPGGDQGKERLARLCSRSDYELQVGFKTASGLKLTDAIGNLCPSVGFSGFAQIAHDRPECTKSFLHHLESNGGVCEPQRCPNSPSSSRRSGRYLEGDAPTRRLHPARKCRVGPAPEPASPHDVTGSALAM